MIKVSAVTDVLLQPSSICLRQENRTCVLLLFCVLLFFFLGLGGWGGVGGHVNVPCTSCIIYCHTTWHVGTLLRSLGSFTTLHVATLLRSLGLSYYVTCWYAAEISGIFYYVTWCFNWICQKSIDFASTFFDQNSVIQRVRKSILYCKLQVMVTLLEANNQNARAVSLPPGSISYPSISP